MDHANFRSPMTVIARFLRLPRPSESRWTSVRTVALSVVLAAIGPTPSNAQTIEFILGAGSEIRRTCAGCDKTAEPIQGSFDLTVMPIPDAHAIEAVTAVRWYSESFRIVGAGFLQRQGRNRTSMVIDAFVNGEPLLLTSSSHPTNERSGLHLSLSSPPDSPIAIQIEMMARANTTDGPDADRDGIPDILDLCPNVPGASQRDADFDGVGDTCDSCPATSLGSPVKNNGCAPSQACPCIGPAPDQPWASQRAYVSCIARTLKELAQAEVLSRPEVRKLVQAAVRSGCGSPILATR